MKRLTGGDRIKAAADAGSFWSFMPSHTFVMLTNHKPIISGDDSVWRRVRLVPFEWGSLRTKRPRTPSTFGPGIGGRTRLAGSRLPGLACSGLVEPDRVRAATAAYRADSDALKRFLDERCVLGLPHTVRSSELFAAWSGWCATDGEQPGTNKAFTTALQEKGFDTKHTRTGTVWQGIGLAADSDGDR